MGYIEACVLCKLGYMNRGNILGVLNCFYFNQEF
jgi:hypothetical protein